MKKITAVEIEPLVGLDNENQVVDRYKDAVGFDVTNFDDPDVIAYGVYVRNSENDLAMHLFDVPDEDNALQVEALLEKLYNL